MKVVHITRGFGDYVVDVINGTARYAESAVVLSEADSWMAQNTEGNIETFLSGAPAVSKFGNCSALVRVAKFLRRLRPDVIHFQAGVVWELLLLHLFPKAAKVVTIHDVVRHPSKEDRRKRIMQAVIDHAGQAADAIIVHGNTLRADARLRFGEKKQIFVVPHGTILKYGTGTGSIIPRDGGRILLFGTLDEWKGVEYLVQAERIISKALPGAKVKIAGRASDPVYYGSLIGAQQNIEMDLRRQSDEDVRQLFSWADVVVLPYIEASQSGVLQLAFAFGVPAVVTAVGALSEVVTNRVNGLIVPPKDVERLADAVIEILSDYSLRASIIRSIVDQRNTIFSRDAIARKTFEVYEWACEFRRNDCGTRSASSKS